MPLRLLEVVGRDDAVLLPTPGHTSFLEEQEPGGE